MKNKRKIVAKAKYMPQNTQNLSKSISFERLEQEGYWEKSLRSFYLSSQRFEEFLEKNFQISFQEFLRTSIEKKREITISFLGRYGFKSVVITDGEARFSSGNESITVLIESDTDPEDVLFGILTSAFTRLEKEIL